MMIAQPNVSRDLDDIPRMMPRASFVLIGAQQECLTVEDPAWNNANRHPAAVLISFEAYHIRGKAIF
jgi:hypothetical protein